MWVDTLLNGLRKTTSVDNALGQTINLVQGDIIVRSSAGLGITDTTNTAASLFANNGVSSFQSYYYNSSSNFITLAGGTGVTIVGPNTVNTGRNNLLVTKIESPTVAKVYVF